MSHLMIPSIHFLLEILDKRCRYHDRIALKNLVKFLTVIGIDKVK
jgi:hypothetical protein